MAAAIPYIGLALSVGGTLAEGQQREQMSAFQAKQLQEQAIQDEAVSQIDARNERKRADYLASKLIARAGASGTAVDSPDIQQQLADIDEQGSYNALAALYSGRTSARTRRLQAKQIRRQGKGDKESSYYGAAADILGTGKDLGWF